MIIPLIIEQMLAVLVGMADSIMVASVGEAAVSGVSLVDNIMVLLINVFSALSTGGAVVAGSIWDREERRVPERLQISWFGLSRSAQWRLHCSFMSAATGSCMVCSDRLMLK